MRNVAIGACLCCEELFLDRKLVGSIRVFNFCYEKTWSNLIRKLSEAAVHISLATEFCNVDTQFAKQRLGDVGNG